MTNKISKMKWQQLMSVAIQFKQLAPWEWMGDSEMFGIQHPETGLTYYCTVMGMGGEMFALGMYKGLKGLDTLMEIATGLADPEEMIFTQDCLMMSLEDKEELLEEDEALYKKLGFSFKGKKAYPTFHDYSPGYMPWTIQTEEEADTMILIITQALEIARLCKDNVEMLYHEDSEDDESVVAAARVWKFVGDTWKDEWELYRDEDFIDDLPDVEVSELYIRTHLSRIPKRADKTWIMDIFHVMMPVQENDEDRPYFPIMILAIEPETGMIVAQEMLPLENVRTDLQKALINMFKGKGTGYIPNEIIIGREETEDYLTLFEEYLGCTITFDDETSEYLDELKQELFESFGGDN